MHHPPPPAVRPIRHLVVLALAVIAASLGEDVVRAAALGFGTGAATAADDTLDFGDGRAVIDFHGTSQIDALGGYVRLVSTGNSQIEAEANGGAHLFSKDFGAGAKAELQLSGNGGWAHLKSKAGAKFAADYDGSAYVNNGTGAQLQVLISGDASLQSSGNGKFTASGGNATVTGSTPGAEMKVESGGSAYLKSSGNAKFNASGGNAIITGSSIAGAEIRVASTGISTLKGSGGAVVTADNAGYASLSNSSTAKISVDPNGDVTIKLGN